MRAAGAALALLIGFAIPANAACPLPTGAGSALETRSTETRLRFLKSRLRQDRRAAKIWTGVWGGAFALSAVLPIALIPTASSSGDRVDLVAGAISGAIGVGALVAGPLAVLDAPDPNVNGSCAELAQAERWLTVSADTEALGRSWIMHAANAGFAVALGLVLGLGFNRWVSALVNGVASLVVGEAFILTQPVGAVDALAQYRRGDFSEAPQVSLALRW